MRRVLFSALIAAGLMTAPVAFASETTPAPAAKPAKPAKDDPNRLVCTREHIVGSNRPQKVCMTVAERQRLKDAAERTMDESRRRGDQSAGAIQGGE